MNLFQIALKNMRQRGVASWLTMISVALGVSLMIAVLVLHGVLGKQFSQSGSGYSLIIGPAGSPTTLVLAVVYRIENSRLNMPWRYYQKWVKDPRVELAIPICFGDTTQEGDFPVIGTSPQYFKLPYARTPHPQPYKVQGNFLKGSWDAVIGSEVARRNGWMADEDLNGNGKLDPSEDTNRNGVLDPGSQFQLVHGGQTGADAHIHEEKFTVRGILQATGTPNDRTVFTHIDGFFMLAGHENPLREAIHREAQYFNDQTEAQLLEQYAPELEAERREAAALKLNPKHAAHAVPDLSKEVSAILIVAQGEDGDELVRSNNALSIQNELSEENAAQAVNPVMVMDVIMRKLVGNLQLAFLCLTGLIVAVSGIGIFVSIYNSMNERRREIAVMRALGAQRRTVSLMILCETLLLCLGGGLLGLLLGHGLMFVAAPILEAKSGLLIDPWAYSPWELVVLPISLVLATLSGLIPSITAYRTDVAETLAQ